MKIGNEGDAKLIYRRRKSGYGPLPKGWRKLGEGTYRSAYLSPDGVVYKVAHPWEKDTNAWEFRNYTRLKSSKIRLPKGWGIAPTYLYSFPFGRETVNVIAMKYIEGTHASFSTWQQSEAYLDKVGADRVFQRCNLYDVHEGNFIVTSTGRKVIIDLGA